MKKLNLAVIFGGQSGEHEVSLASAIGVIGALDREKYNIIPIAITKKGFWLAGEDGQAYLDANKHLAGKENAISIEKSQELVKEKGKKRNLDNFIQSREALKDVDLVFPLIHGSFGEDGRLQGFLDIVGVKYVFSGCLAHALGMNKSKAKIIVRDEGVGVAEEAVLSKLEKYDLENIIDTVKFPMMVKPLELGSSVGVNLVRDKESLKKAMEEAFSFGDKIMIEKYIKGRELTVTVMGNNSEIQALGVTEIIPVVSEFYDYKAKYEQGGSKHVCPAEIPADAEKIVKEYAVKIFKAIGCQDLARADFIWDEEENEFYFIDLNTVPGMTATSLVPETAKCAGMEFGEFLDKLIEYNL